MLTQCWPLCPGQCGYVVAVNGLQVGHEDAVPMPQQFKAKRTGNDANPCGFKSFCSVLHVV